MFHLKYFILLLTCIYFVLLICKDNDEMSIYSDDNDDNVLLINKVSISLKTAIILILSY